MKKALIFVIVIAAAIIVYALLGESGPTGTQPKVAGAKKATTQIESTESVSETSERTVSTSSQPLPAEIDSDLDEQEEAYDDRPAYEIYSSAEEALAAVKKAAVDYDDIVLEQFTELGEGCTWCDEFYQGVSDIAFGADVDEETRSYFTEILAISGQVKNVEKLIKALEGEQNQDVADLYAESLELAMGNDDLVAYLEPHLESNNELLQESVVAAMTNHGSRYAIDVLHKHTVAKGNPDGYYELGIGLGEVIPDNDALPFLQELTLKRDPYSHLALKALLNQGLDGLRLVIDSLTNSPDPEFDKKMLTDAIDHVNYEEDVEQYVKNAQKSAKDEVVKEFLQDIIEDFEIDSDEVDLTNP